MEISLTREEFKRLLRLAHLGNWMVNAVRGGRGSKRLSEYDELESRLLALADEAGLSAWVERFNDKAMPSEALMEDVEIKKLIEAYDDEVFWGDLAHELAHRDFDRSYGPDFKLTKTERAKKFKEFEERYEREFKRFGIDRLELRMTIEDVIGSDSSR